MEFHASEAYARRSRPWKDLTQDDARGMIKSVLDVLAKAYDTARAFACVVHKASFPNQDPMEVAFEDLCSRFDRYLQRLRANGDTQRGLLILDKSAHETTLQQMSVGFRTLGGCGSSSLAAQSVSPAAARQEAIGSVKAW